MVEEMRQSAVDILTNFTLLWGHVDEYMKTMESFAPDDIMCISEVRQVLRVINSEVSGTVSGKEIQEHLHDAEVERYMTSHVRMFCNVCDGVEREHGVASLRALVSRSSSKQSFTLFSLSGRRRSVCELLKVGGGSQCPGQIGQFGR